MKADIKFRPLQQETLALLYMAYEAEGKDPVAAYSRLMSAMLMSGAVLGLSREQIRQQVDACYPMAESAVKDRKDIFGPGKLG